MRALWLSLLAAALAGSATAAGNGNDWAVRHFSSTEGLPVSTAAAARTDVDGFLWVATHDGLARFDGSGFDVYDMAGHPQMTSNRIQALHTGEAGQILALTDEGRMLGVAQGRVAEILFGPRSQPVRHLDGASLCVSVPAGLYCPDGDGYRLRYRFGEGQQGAVAVPDADEAVWVVVPGRGVFFDSAAGPRSVFESDALRLSPELALSSAVRLSEAGDLWVTSIDTLLAIDRSGAVRRFAHEPPLIILQVRFDPGDPVPWVGTDRGLFRATGEGLVPAFGESGPAQSVPPGPAPERAGRSWRAPDGALWHADGGQLRREGRLLLDSRGEVRDVYFDNGGSVWVSTLRDGLYALSRQRVVLLDLQGPPPSANVYSVSRGSDGTMWLGTLGDGLKAVQPDGAVHSYGREQGLPGLNAWVVAAAPDGGVYAATYSPGLHFKDAGDDTFRLVPLPPPASTEQVLSLSFGPDDRLWIAGVGGVWRRDAGEWSLVWLPEARRRVHSVLHMGDGTRYYGTNDGLWRQVGAAPAVAVARQLLAGAEVRDVFRDSGGALWVSSGGRALVRIAADDPTGVRAVRLGRVQGLPSNSPHAVLEDAAGSIWVNSNQGIFRITPTGLRDFLQGRVPTLSPLALGRADGLTELEGNGGVQPAAAFDGRGRIWFPSQRGVVQIDPLAMPLRTVPPVAVIDSLESEGGAIGLAEGGALPAGTRSLLIQYGAADLHAGSEVRFRYRLLPGEERWTDAGTRRAASFAALAPGAYRFELLAGNSDGYWSEAPVGLDFSVPPEWHERRAVHALVWLALLAGGLLLARARFRELAGRARVLDQRVQVRTQELRQQKSRAEGALLDLAQAHDDLADTHRRIERSNRRLADQATRLEALDRFRSRLLADVSHELRTPLMLVTLPLQELAGPGSSLGGTERRRVDLALTQAGRLNSLVAQLVELVQAEAGQLKPKMARVELVGFVQQMVAAYLPALQQGRVGLRLTASMIRQTVFADREQLTTILGNLIDNAGKHSPAGSEVEIDLRIEGPSESVRITVTDHGGGFEPELAEQLFERFFRGEGPPRGGREGLGIGLALARELVDLHGGRIGAEGRPGQGATFWFELPLGSAHIALDELSLRTATDAWTGAGGIAPGDADVGDGGRLLLVEDHPDLAAYLSERLSDHVPVQWATDAEQAWQLLETEPFGMLVCDVMLPGESGISLCRRLRSDPRFGALPMVLISAKAGEDSRQAGLDAGADDYLAKPFGLDALLDRIRRFWPAGMSRHLADSATSTAEPLAAAVRHHRLLQEALSELSDAGFGVASWAQRMQLSERQLRRRVVEATGHPPLVWLREQRLQRVRALVSSGECKTLVQAGARCGLDNPSYLYRIYRARFGDAEG